MSIPPRLLSPWAITEQGLQLIASIASRGELYEEVKRAALEARDGEALVNNASQYQLDNGVAVISVAGPLFKHATLLSAVSGAGSYESIRKQFDAAINDDGCKSILLDVNSPGGEVHGCGELADYIYSKRGSKPIVAYASGDCCSAAYWIASACNSIVCAPTAIVGSIGVRSMLVDDSKRDEMQGVKEYQIVSDQSPYKVTDPSSSADRERAIAKLTDVASVFISAIAKFRGVSDTEVEKKYGKGDVFVGQKAIAAGLADSLGDFDSLYSSLSQPKGIFAMSKKTASMDSGECDACSRAMAGDDDTYCKACYGSEGAVFTQEIFALAGSTDKSRVMGILTAMKSQAEKAEKLEAELTALSAEKEKGEITRLLDEAIASHQIEKSKRADAEAFASKHGIAGLQGMLAVIPRRAAHVPALPVVEAPVAGKAAAGSDNRDFNKILRATGLSAEDFAKAQARYNGIINQTQDEE